MHCIFKRIAHGFVTKLKHIDGRCKKKTGPKAGSKKYGLDSLLINRY